MAATKCQKYFNSYFAYTFNFECCKRFYNPGPFWSHPYNMNVMDTLHHAHTHLHTPRLIYAPTLRLTMKKLHVLSNRLMVLKYPPIPLTSETSTFCSWKGLHALQYNKTKTPYYNQFGSACNLLSRDRERLADRQAEREGESCVCVGGGGNRVILDKFHLLSSSFFTFFFVSFSSIYSTLTLHSLSFSQLLITEKLETKSYRM